MTPEEERQRLQELSQHLVLAMTSMMTSNDWLGALYSLAELGREAEQFIADYQAGTGSDTP